MNDSYVRFLFFKIHFAESEEAFRYKIDFLYSVSLATAASKNLLKYDKMGREE